MRTRKNRQDNIQSDYRNTRFPREAQQLFTDLFDQGLVYPTRLQKNQMLLDLDLPNDTKMHHSLDIWFQIY